MGADAGPLRSEPAGAMPGELVVARAWKYDGGPHWVVPGTYLGADAAGHWIFQPAGAFVARPGAGFYAASDAVCLIPHQERSDRERADPEAAVRTADWVATFYDAAHPGDFRIYIDVSTAIGWRPLQPAGWEIHSVDMDLDVIRSSTRGVYLDDEDEFAEHGAAYGYPDELVERMRASAAELVTAVEGGRGVFEADPESGASRAARAWLEDGRRLASSSGG
ncbi:hypothetical protein GCM10022377_06050 [Zhihengliuella alba]|uniref:DUF402 domain-containing protein n=1 Tax=Zhihengliuella alba TaxID=547018 RepID=A0ABP7CX43_9MICC